MEYSKRRQYIDNKVKGYMIQDAKAGREYDKKDYITPEWIKDKYNEQNKEMLSLSLLFSDGNY